MSCAFCKVNSVSSYSGCSVIGLADQKYELKTLGEAKCDITLKNSSISTTQTVVVVETAGYEMFLSRRVLTELGMLPAGFPNLIKEMVANTLTRTCGCPTRETVPAPPEWPAARIANRAELEKLLVMPAMSGMPLHVQLKEGATPPTVANKPARCRMLSKQR